MARKIDEKKVANMKKEIIDTSITLIMEKGFSKFTLSSVAKELGITKAALYWYFSTKEDLIKSIVESVRNSQLNMIQELEKSELSAKEKLYQILSVTGKDNKSCVLPIKMLLEFYSEENDITMEIQKGYKMYTQVLSGILLEGKNNGEFKNNVSEEEMAKFIISTLDGFAMHNLILEEEYEPLSTHSFSFILESILEPKKDAI